MDEEIIKEFVTYLEYLKELGIEEISANTSLVRHFRSTYHVAKDITLGKIRSELAGCKRCKLHRTRKNIVFGEGDSCASLMFVGEGPGFDEDVQGRPFVGRAGQLLTRIIQSMGLERRQVYITNIIKCRPPGNRNPEPEEIESCEPYLLKQIQAIKPRIICTLGTFASQTILKSADKITSLRGKVYEINGIKVVPTYHPAFLLRNPDKKRETWEDMKRILEIMQTGQSVR